MMIFIKLKKNKNNYYNRSLKSLALTDLCENERKIEIITIIVVKEVDTH